MDALAMMKMISLQGPSLSSLLVIGPRPLPAPSPPEGPFPPPPSFPFPSLPCGEGKAAAAVTRRVRTLASFMTATITREGVKCWVISERRVKGKLSISFPDLQRETEFLFKKSF